MDAGLSHEARSISLCSLATLNNRIGPLLGKVNRALQSTICIFAVFSHERRTKTLDLKGKGNWGY